jgi:hypothetical protein
MRRKPAPFHSPFPAPASPAPHPPFPPHYPPDKLPHYRYTVPLEDTS